MHARDEAVEEGAARPGASYVKACACMHARKEAAEVEGGHRGGGKAHAYRIPLS